MASRDLTLVLKARDEASKALTGLGLNAVKTTAALTLAGAGAATLTGALSSAAGEATRFETGMREVNTLVNLSETEYAKLTDQTRELSERMGVDAVQSSKALYQAISAGVPKENAMEFLKIASKAAIGGVTDTETAVDGLTTVLNAFKLDASETAHVADVMFTTVKQGKTTMTELSKSLFNVAPMAAMAGVSFDEVAASIATLTKQGTPTSVATTQMRAAIQAIIKPTDEMAVAISRTAFELDKQGKLAGGPAVDNWRNLQKSYAEAAKRSNELQAELKLVDTTTKEGAASAKELQTAIKFKDKNVKDLSDAVTEAGAALGTTIIKSEGLNGAMAILAQTADGNTNTLGKMFGSVEGLAAVLGTTGDNAKMFAGDLKAVGDATGASQAAFDEMNKSTARWHDQMKAKLQSVSIQVGEFLGPTQGIIAILPGLSAGFTAAGGAIGLATKLLAGNTIANIAHKIATVAGTLALGAMTAAQWLLNAALTANPIGIVVIALAALAAAVVWAYQNVDWFRKIVDDAFALLQTAVPKAIEIAQGAINGLIGAIRGAIDAGRNLLDLLGKIPGAGAIGGAIGGAVQGYAAGGVVPGPLGMPQLAVVHGGERIVPRNRGGGDIYVTVNVQGSVTAERDLAETVRRELLRVKSRNTNTGL